MLFLLSPKKKKKLQAFPIFFNTQTSEQQVHQPPISKSMPTHSVAPSFPKNISNPQASIKKLVNEYNVYYHPRPSVLISSIYPSWLHQSPEFLLNFLLNLLIPFSLGKIFLSYGVEITGKCICEQGLI